MQTTYNKHLHLSYQTAHILLCPLQPMLYSVLIAMNSSDPWKKLKPSNEGQDSY
jgi:hypothetical protein